MPKARAVTIICIWTVFYIFFTETHSLDRSLTSSRWFRDLQAFDHVDVFYFIKCLCIVHKTHIHAVACRGRVGGGPKHALVSHTVAEFVLKNNYRWGVGGIKSKIFVGVGYWHPLISAGRGNARAKSCNGSCILSQSFRICYVLSWHVIFKIADMLWCSCTSISCLKLCCFTVFLKRSLSNVFHLLTFFVHCFKKKYFLTPVVNSVRILEMSITKTINTRYV